MKALKIIAYIIAAILIIFGVLYILSVFGPGGNTGRLLIGLILVGIAFVLIFWAARQPAVSSQQNVTVKIDLPGGVEMDTIKCKSCGGVITAENIKLVAGAPVVSCPFCGTTYQITEEPKW